MTRLLLLFFLTFVTLWADRPVFSIKAGVVKDFPPQYSLDENGKPQGFAIDVFDALMKEMEASWEYVVFETWDEVFTAQKNGIIDVIPNQGITPKRKEIALFTAPLETFEVGMFVLRKDKMYESLLDLEGTYIGTVKNNVGERLMVNIAEAKPKVFETHEQMIFALLSGKIDGFIYPRSVTKKLLKELGLEERILPLGAPLLSVKRAVGVRHQKKEFYEKLQPVVQKFLQSAEFSTIYKKWYGEDEGLSKKDVEWLGALFVLMIISLLGIYYWVLKRNERLLKQNVAVKTQALKEEVEQHRQTEALLRKSEERFKLLFEKAPVAYQSLDESGQVYAINEQWLYDMGYQQKEEILGRWFGDFLDDEGRANFGKKFQQLKEEGTIERVEFVMQTKQGESLVMEMTGRLYAPFDNAYHMHCVLVNVTEARSQEEIMLSQSRLAAMGEMIGMIAHQWRQPLAVISMEINNIFADIELKTLDEKELQTTLKAVTRQIMFLSQTIEDFRNFFQPNKAKITTSLDAIMNDALTIVGKSLENNGIEIIREGSLSQLGTFYANELVQVLLNILNNARDAFFQEKRQGAWVKIVMKDDLMWNTIIIEDNGGGIDAKILPRIFEPYVSSKSKNGTGLGLYMSKTIIEKHCQGKLLCANTKEGAHFTIMLPKS